MTSTREDAADAGALLELMRPALPGMGVSRVADITGLDRIGIPVAISVRPDSMSLAVDGGKGMTRDAAMASAVMESAERFWSDRASGVEDIMRPAWEPVTEFIGDDWPLLVGAVPPAPRDMIRWAGAVDLLSEKRVYVPWRVAVTDFQSRNLVDKRHFSSSNGLSAGLERGDAVFQGLLEVLERDACHTEQVRLSSGGSMLCVDWSTVEDVALLGLRDRIAGAGCGVKLCRVPCWSGTAVYMAWIYDRECPEIGIYKGYGAHPNGAVAAVRAICEAAQARCLLMAGARDDFTQEISRRSRNFAAEIWREFSVIPETDGFDAGRTGIGLRELVADVIEAGFERVLVLDFEVEPWCPAKVVRVMVPGAEGYYTQHTGTLGIARQDASRSTLEACAPGGVPSDAPLDEKEAA